MATFRESSFRFVIGLLSCLAAAVVGAVYLNPFALHRIIAVTYSEIDTGPNAEDVVTVKGERFSFLLPVLTLDAKSVEEIRQSVKSIERTEDVVSALATKVRMALHGASSQGESGYGKSAEELFRDGTKYSCLCSEYAMLFNEMLQACGIHSRIVWLEGHVATEYFHPQSAKWVYTDSHLNLQVSDDEGRPLSLSQLVRLQERGEVANYLPLLPNEAMFASLGEGGIAEHAFWLRNVLLNGEFYILTGQTLSSRSRWSQLAVYQSLPTLVILQTDFERPVAGRFQRLSGRQILTCGLLFFLIYLASTGIGVLVINRVSKRTS